MYDRIRRCLFSIKGIENFSNKLSLVEKPSNSFESLLTAILIFSKMKLILSNENVIEQRLTKFERSPSMTVDDFHLPLPTFVPFVKGNRARLIGRCSNRRRSRWERRTERRIWRPCRCKSQSPDPGSRCRIERSQVWPDFCFSRNHSSSASGKQKKKRRLNYLINRLK